MPINVRLGVTERITYYRKINKRKGSNKGIIALPRKHIGSNAKIIIFRIRKKILHYG